MKKTRSDLSVDGLQLAVLDVAQSLTEGFFIEFHFLFENRETLCLDERIVGNQSRETSSSLLLYLSIHLRDDEHRFLLSACDSSLVEEDPDLWELNASDKAARSQLSEDFFSPRMRESFAALFVFILSNAIRLVTSFSSWPSSATIQTDETMRTTVLVSNYSYWSIDRHLIEHWMGRRLH